MVCIHKDCINYYKGLACIDCWRNKGLYDRYQSCLPYYDQGRITNMLGRVWEEYVMSGLTKHNAERILYYIQILQTLIMGEGVG